MEARVLTLKEIKRIDPKKEYWSEYYGIELIKDSFSYDEKDDQLISNWEGAIYNDISIYYGKTIRLWTSLPTEEQINKVINQELK